MKVFKSTIADINHWLNLSSEAEYLTCSLSNNYEFYHYILKFINQGTAFCIREGDGSPGTPLMGGLLFSPQLYPIYKISLLVVSNKWRNQGVGRTLVEHTFSLIKPPAELIVTTYAENYSFGASIRVFYKKLGFYPADILPSTKNIPFQVFRRIFDENTVSYL